MTDHLGCARKRPLPPGGGGLRLLASEASLEAKGEGDTLAAGTARRGSHAPGVSPSPFRPRRFGGFAACDAKGESPPPPGGRGRFPALGSAA